MGVLNSDWLRPSHNKRTEGAEVRESWKGSKGSKRGCRLVGLVGCCSVVWECVCESVCQCVLVLLWLRVGPR